MPIDNPPLWHDYTKRLYEIHGQFPNISMLSLIVMFLSSLGVLGSKYNLVGIPKIYASVCVRVCVRARVAPVQVT